MCDECSAGERDSVGTLGDNAVANLASALRGPPPDRFEAARQRILSSYAPVPGTAITQDEFVGRLLERYVAQYQSRAALGLASIHTRAARQALARALDSAAIRNYRADVVRTIESARAQASFQAFSGSLSDSSVPFGAEVWVRRGPGPAWNGNESVFLNGAPFPDSLLLEHLGDSLRFVAIGLTGRYFVSIGGLGQPADTMIATLRIDRIPPTVRSLATADTTTVLAQLPMTQYLAFGVAAGRIDTAHHQYFRFSQAATRRVTAIAETPGLRAPDVSWLRCTPAAPLIGLGPVVVLAGVMVDQRGQPVEGARVEIRAVGPAAVTDQLGRFHLSGVPPPLGGTVRLTVTKPQFRRLDQQVQAGDSGIRLTLLSTDANELTARSQRGTSILIPSDECRILRVVLGPPGPIRIVRLRLTSP
jgi:hypothetical protein